MRLGVCWRKCRDELDTQIMAFNILEQEGHRSVDRMLAAEESKLTTFALHDEAINMEMHDPYAYQALIHLSQRLYSVQLFH